MYKAEGGECLRERVQEHIEERSNRIKESVARLGVLCAANLLGVDQTKSPSE